MTFSQADQHYMALAIKLAKQGHYTSSPNPRVGCVLVKNGEIIGQGFHIKAGDGHAEVNAIAQAGNAAKGATAYVTLEPCSHYGRTPPCAEGLINAGVIKVIAAMVDPNPQVSGRGLAMLTQAGIETASGLLAQEASTLNKGFITLMTEQRPYVRCKLAASLDGKTAMASGESKWITGDDARADVQRLRAQSCAIISGADSIITDNAKMTVRYEQLPKNVQQHIRCAGQVRQPARIIIDTQHRITANLALFEQASDIYLVRTSLDNNQQWPHFVKQLIIPAAPSLDQPKQYVDLVLLLTELATLGFNDVLVESGGKLAGAFIEQQLVDELILYQAAKLLGADAKSLLVMPNIISLSQAKSLIFKDVTMVGADLRITAHFKENH